MIETFASIIKLHRLDRHLSIEAVAEQSGLPAERVKALEDGLDAPCIVEVLGLARTYNVDADFIVKRLHRFYERFVNEERRGAGG